MLVVSFFFSFIFHGPLYMEFFPCSLSDNAALCGVPSLPPCSVLWGTHKLSSGAKVGIAFAVVAIIVIVGSAAYLIIQRKNREDYKFGLPHQLASKWTNVISIDDIFPNRKWIMIHMTHAISRQECSLSKAKVKAEIRLRWPAICNNWLWKVCLWECHSELENLHHAEDYEEIIILASLCG